MKNLLAMRVVLAMLVWTQLAGCQPVRLAPTQQKPAASSAPVRDWFSRAELETALLAANVAAEDAPAALCSADPVQPDHLHTCVQFGPEGGPEAQHQWWVAKWDQTTQHVVVNWQSNVEVQLDD